MSCCADPEVCDGEWHTCYNCGGEGEIESEDWQDDEMEPCSICGGSGGWECPDPLSRRGEK